MGERLIEVLFGRIRVLFQPCANRGGAVLTHAVNVSRYGRITLATRLIVA